MRIHVRVHGHLVSRAGGSDHVLRLPGESATVREAVMRFAEEHRGIEGCLGGVAYAIGDRFAGPEARLADGDRLILLPPVSGG